MDNNRGIGCSTGPERAHTATDGASAIAAARSTRPDAVVLGVMLPDMRGLGVPRRLRAITGWVKTPFPARQVGGTTVDDLTGAHR